MPARLGMSGCPGDYESKPLLGPRLALKICRRPRCYCCSLTVASQVVIAVMLKRTAASSNEQK
jgi:hypothetical protein